MMKAKKLLIWHMVFESANERLVKLEINEKKRRQKLSRIV